MKLCKKNKADPASRTAVLGHAPYDTKQFSLWTKSRHPNYFCEWMCWNSFMLMGIPSLMALEDKRQIKLGLALSYYMVSRLFFDCLCYWTGGEPAEHFSVAKRPNFKEYQTKTRMFFPFEVPFFNHHRIAVFFSFEVSVALRRATLVCFRQSLDQRLTNARLRWRFDRRF